MAGTWLVKIPPITLAMSDPLCLIEQLLFEIGDAHARLLRAEVLHVEAENPGEFGKIIDIATGCDHREHVAGPHGLALLGRQLEFRAIGIFIGQKKASRFPFVEGKAHRIDGIALFRGIAVEHGRPRYRPLCGRTLYCISPRPELNWRGQKYSMQRIQSLIYDKFTWRG